MGKYGVWGSVETMGEHRRAQETMLNIEKSGNHGSMGNYSEPQGTS